MVPDDSKSIRERAIAAWPPAWHGGNLRDMLITLGYDVDRPWRELPKKAVPVYIGGARSAGHDAIADASEAQDARMARFSARLSFGWETTSRGCSNVVPG